VSESKSALLTLVVDVERDIPEQGASDYWEWLFAYKHDISVRSVTSGRPAQGNQVCGENEWCQEHFSSSEVFHEIVEEELPLKAGSYLVTGRMWGTRDYWGEYDEGFDTESFKRSPGNCKRFWRRRAHERKAEYQSWAHRRLHL
jgi:hypothetical protein